ncbi:MAG: nuclear transport factor 2 family protein [Candidatus Limnocylindrales bacterium]
MNGETVRAGFDLLLEQGPEAIVDWLDPDVEMLGPSPSPWDCHGRDAVVRFLWEFKPGGTGLEVTESSDLGDRVLLGLRRRYGPRETRDSYSVVSFHDGRVIKMQGYPTRDEAVAAIAAVRRPPAAQR